MSYGIFPFVLFNNLKIISSKQLFFLAIFFLLFICAYNVQLISLRFPLAPPPPPPPTPSSSPHHPLLLLPPTPSLIGRNNFALISNFVEERV
jgi:hypothetical protein